MQRVIVKVVREILFFLAVAFFVILSAFPFYWMVITSFKTNSDLYSVTNIPFWFNDPPTLEHFRYLFHETLFVTWLLNSLIIGVCVVLITLVTALPAAYSLARMTGRNGETLGIGIFLTYLVPPTLLFLPLARVVAESRAAEFNVVLSADLPDFHDPVLYLAVDGILQGPTARDRGGGGRRRLQLVRSLRQDGAPSVAAGDSDGSDLHVHFDLAGICLRVDLHFYVGAEADHARRGDRPHSRRHLLLGRDHGWSIDRQHSSSDRLQLFPR